MVEYIRNLALTIMDCHSTAKSTGECVPYLAVVIALLLKIKQITSNISYSHSFNISIVFAITVLISRQAT